MEAQERLRGLFPEPFRRKWETAAVPWKGLREIRLRAGRPVTVLLQDGEWYPDVRGGLTRKQADALRLQKEELEEILQHICRYSLYAHEEEMRRGYISAPGGIRIGIAGEVIPEPDGGVRNIRHVSSLNIRVAHAVQGAAEGLLPWLYEAGRLCSILIISPPGCGKTTLLRDIIRLVSDGNRLAAGLTVGVVDERSELAGCFQGVPAHDLGNRTDVLDNCPKARGMMMLLRSMSPGAIAVDELGGEEDIRAVLQAVRCGCGVLATLHGDSCSALARKTALEPLRRERVFERLILLRREKGYFCAAEIRDGDGALLERDVPCC